ncbi:hypothetical protein BC830DRAFT_1173059 [Chytriomyces sp. MP71]|nr:hypothetical protein BC830DRAFT_1173059 [Chytriomyces sp. MP71]
MSFSAAQIVGLPQPANLQACVSQFENYFPSASLFDTYRHGERIRQNRFPAAVVYANSESDIKTALQCATANGYHAVVRSGGHSYEALSSMDGQLVIDISGYNVVTVNAARKTAVAQVGVRLGNLYTALSPSNLLFPAGTCATVGLGGQLSAGGYGMLGRYLGLAIDNVLSFRVMDYQGSVQIASPSSNPDLFWAMLGGGGGVYGIMLDATLRLHARPPAISFGAFSWSNLNTQQLKSFLSVWQNFAPSTSNALTTQFMFNGGNTVQLNAKFIGTSAELMNVLQQSGLFTIAGGGSQYVTDCSDVFCGNWNPYGTPGTNAVPARYQARDVENSKTKSDYFRKLLPDAGLNAVINNVNTMPSGAWIQFEGFGNAGAVATRGDSDTPYPHRVGTLMSVQYWVVFDATRVEPLDSANYAWLHKPAVSNFGAANFARLQAIKAKVDPFNVFVNPMFPNGTSF